MPVRPGELVNIGLDFYFPTATTLGASMQLRAIVESFDASGVELSVGMLQGYLESIPDLYTNTALPNLSAGRERWLPLNLTVVQVSAGAASMAVGFTRFSWLGDPWVTNLAVIIAAALN